MSEQKKTRGRPKKNDADIRRCTVNINVTALEKWAVSSAAEAAGLSVSDYLREALLKELKH